MVSRWGGERGLVLSCAPNAQDPGDHEGLPYGSSGLQPVFIAQVDAYYRRFINPRWIAVLSPKATVTP